VGHSIAGVELSSVANSGPNRVAGLVYLDAAYSYAFDNGNGTSIMEMQKLQRPQPPPPGKTDLASLSALQKYYERVNGFRFPPKQNSARRGNPLLMEGWGNNVIFPAPPLFMPLMTGHEEIHCHSGTCAFHLCKPAQPRNLG
jgi:non-heme chloroperoxidase